MKVNRIGLALLFLLCGSSVSAESLYKYRVQLTDKSKSVHSLEHPETFLSERALARRASQGVAVDSTDLPVCRAYIERLESQGGKYISSSKWNNTVLIQVPDEAVALRFLDNSFVRSIKKVWVSPDSIMPRNKDRKEQVKNQWKSRMIIMEWEPNKSRFTMETVCIWLDLKAKGYRLRSSMPAFIMWMP